MAAGPERRDGGAPGAPAVAIDAGTGPPVLLVHGQPGSGAGWGPVAALLRDDFRVIAPDRPGWGSHPRPATTLAGNASSLERLLADRGVTTASGPVVVVGHSLGGGIALELAFTRPDLVGALVLVSSVGVGPAVTGMDRLLAVPVVGDQLLRAGAAALRRSVRQLSRLTRSKRGEVLLERANRFPSVRAMMAEGEREMDGRDRRSFLVEQRALVEETPRISERLPTIRVPTVVIHGTADHIVSPHAAVLLAASIPGAELVLRPHEGHLLAFERPEVIAEAVRRYARLTRSSRQAAPG